jgi:hypothetical protein
LVALVCCLNACGPDPSSEEAGVGVGGSGVGPSSAAGTVTGFGSLIVDGVRWEDRAARVETEIDPRAAPIDATVKLGQRVGIEYQTAGEAEVVMIEPEVIAPIAAISVAASPAELLAAGQSVLINFDATAGPVTVFEGFDLVTDLRVGDPIEVHGVQRFSAAGGRYAVAAARIQRLAALPAGFVRVSGIVEALASDRQSFRIGELTVYAARATFQPAGRAIANGDRVTVWSSAAPTGTALNADIIRVRTGDTARIVEVESSGYVGRFDAAARSFELNGVRVNARNATLAPVRAVLTDGAYVRVAGKQQANGSINATNVEVRTATARNRYIDLSGPVSDYQGLDRFYIRGVRIDADDVATLTNCPNNRIGNGSNVNVVGSIKGSKVEAVQLQCTNGSAGVVVDISGVASQVSVAGRTFKLTPAGMPARDVAWSPLTLFNNVSPGTLEGKTVEVIGLNDPAGGRLLAVYVEGR